MFFFCALSRREVYGPFVFGEPTVTGSAYLATVQLWLFSQLKESEPDNFILEEDRVSDCVYVPPLPTELPDLRHRIEAAVARITSGTLNKVWDELSYRLDVYRVMNGAHIKHLEEVNKASVHLWPGCKLSPTMAQTEKASGWSPEEFHAKFFPTVEINRRHSGMVVTAFP
ncbi:uncharacterized protein TNCV_3230581 [Trichonephila clavipes]|nr:uncharacterized protein TNCV_3230581 [Trichonephila clavipes]